MSITAFLNNSETWILNKTEATLLEKTEIKALKDLFDLPLHTPTSAILYTFGILLTKIRIDQKQLMYLNRILKREPEQWTLKTLSILEELNIGWYKNINSVLTEF